MAGDPDAPCAELGESTNNGKNLSSSRGDGGVSGTEGEASSAAGPEPPEDIADDSVSDQVDEARGPEPEIAEDRTGRSRSPVFWMVALGLIASIALAGLIGWQCFLGHRLGQDQHHQDAVIEAARQGALNLTTLDWEHADNDVQRILNSATGAFYDDFSRRMKPFVEVLQKAKSRSIGTVTEIGLESESDGKAQVLVAVRIDTTNAGMAEQEPRHWRMRLSVEDVGHELKISNVAFVP